MISSDSDDKTTKPLYWGDSPMVNGGNVTVLNVYNNKGPVVN